MAFTLATAGAASGAEIDSCLLSTRQREHRIDRQENAKFCIDKFKNSITQSACNELVDKNVVPLASTVLTDEMRGLCFYETTLTTDVGTCLKSAKKFKISANQDEAVFYCYQQFQEKIGKTECLKIADRLIFPAKRDYLKQHCIDNN